MQDTTGCMAGNTIEQEVEGARQQRVCSERYEKAKRHIERMEDGTQPAHRRPSLARDLILCLCLI